MMTFCAGWMKARTVPKAAGAGNKVMGLTEKECLFVRYQVEYPGESVEFSAARAGYSAERALQTGRELIKKPKIREAIEAARDGKQQPAQLSKDDILADMLKCREQAIQEGKLKERMDCNRWLNEHFGCWDKGESVKKEEKPQARIIVQFLDAPESNCRHWKMK